MSTLVPIDLLDLARSYWREAHEWICWGRHGGLCSSNDFDHECEFPPDEVIREANLAWLRDTDDGFNHLEYGRWDREERTPSWPYSPGTHPRYRTTKKENTRGEA